jgi:hypothetical protein
MKTAPQVRSARSRKNQNPAPVVHEDVPDRNVVITHKKLAAVLPVLRDLTEQGFT